MITATYKFTRSGDIDGFLKTNRASTDALGVLATWKGNSPSRYFEVVEDSDAQGDAPDFLVAKMSTAEADVDDSRRELDKLGFQFGVQRTAVE
jgi:hypothetical protein